MIKYNEDGRECESCMGYISCLDWMQDGLKAKRDSCKGWYYANKEQVEGLLTDWDYRRGKIKPKCKDDKNMKKQCSNCKWGEDEHSPCMMDGAIICEQPNVHLWEPIEQQTKYDPKEYEIRLRGAILSKALEIINGERQDRYGSPEDSFGIIAEYWNTYLESIGVSFDVSDLSRADIPIMMALFKIARMSGQKYTQDNFVDAAGYLGIADDMAAQEDGK